MFDKNRKLNPFVPWQYIEIQDLRLFLRHYLPMFAKNRKLNICKIFFVEIESAEKIMNIQFLMFLIHLMQLVPKLLMRKLMKH